MVTFKNIRIKIGKKPKGKDTRKSRLQRVKVLASGKFKFVKNLTRSKSKATKPKTKSTKRRKSSLNRSVNRTAKGKSLVQTAYKLIPMIALAAPAVGTAIRSDITGKQKFGVAIRSYTGYSMPGTGLGTKGFSLGHLAEGWLPFIGSVLVIKGAQKLRGLISRI